ncbi:Sodium-dependent glucose transporter 1 [Pseudolycoriella hygida]|uniref:Sodium-dependent glucose transporter 1 n=1 Tax=Pseudolycoriella hygida TaxID=35572 RepID=A0A9Q0N4T3_9DIPT|nr:Sodium-dependent glucose transporter 1 [Pseudolycoriella hygida]
MSDNRPESVFSTSSRRTKYIVSFAVYYCNLVFGAGVTFLSPLVLEFTRRFNASVDEISRVFTIILICYMSSALLCTLLFKCVNRQFVVLFLLSFVACSFFLIPAATNLTQFYLFSSLIGVGSGGYDTAQVAWIIDIWRDESAPWILSQHFAYSLGTLGPPLIISHFLPSNHSTEATGFGTDALDIHIPFYITGSMTILAVAINFVIFFTFLNRNPVISIGNNIQEAVVVPSTQRGSISSSSSTSSISASTPLLPRNRNRNLLKRKIYLIVLSCCVIGFYSALELCTQQFLPTYAHFSPMKLSPTEGARVLFGLQLGFTIGRFVGIFLVQKISPHFIFTGNLILLTISNTILFVWGGHSITLLWVGSIMIGVGMSTVYPSLYAFIEKYLFITESVSGIITVSSSFVAAMYPVIVGNSVETNPEILMYVNYVSISVCYIAFSLLFSMTFMRRSRGRV